jgi:glycosyltransferase involved in cell wall biosynthesis
MNFYPDSKKNSKTIPSGTLFFEHVEASVDRENHQRPIFLHAGSFVWEKNHEFLLRIFQAYLKDYQHGTLWLLGDGKLQAKIKELVLQMRLQDHVIFWGYRKDIPHIIKSADVLLMPSVVEGMPGVILESLSCGTPVIASHVGGIPEVIQNDVNGFCVSEFDEAQYVKLMYILATDNNVRLRFIKAGRLAVKENFNIAVIAKRFLECYLQLITNN